MCRIIFWMGVTALAWPWSQTPLHTWGSWIFVHYKGYTVKDWRHEGMRCFPWRDIQIKLGTSVWENIQKTTCITINKYAFVRLFGVPFIMSCLACCHTGLNISSRSDLFLWLTYATQSTPTGKALDSQFSRENVQMVNKYMEGYSLPLVIREC